MHHRPGWRQSSRNIVRKSNFVVSRLRRTLGALLNQASLYRLTDDALLLSSALAGIVVGLVIVAYHSVLELFEVGLQFLAPGVFQSITWTEWLIPVIGMLGGLLVGVLKKYVFKDVTHRGLASVSDQLKMESMQPISWKLSFHAILLSTISIGTGGGAGRESPTVILGASVSSGLGRIGVMSKRHIRVLGAAGAAAAISGIFNAPLGGILFAVEAITGELRARTFIPIVIASVLATSTVRAILGNKPLLMAPLAAPITLLDYPLLALAGILSAFVAAYYLRSYRFSADKTTKLVMKLPFVLRPALGGLLASLPLIFLPQLLETSYNPINQAIAGQGLWWIALATVLVKPITNAITLASGGEGGTFAPALKVGALFGFCFGTALMFFVPETSVGLYAIVGAAAVIAGAFAAPLTGGILLFEISGNYSLLLPLLFTSVFSTYIIRRMKVKTFNPIQEDEAVSN